MATTNYNLPTITGNMTADVVRDMNALAEATDSALKGLGDGKASNTDLTQLQTQVTTHLDDSMPHKFTDGATKYKYGFKTNAAKDGLIFVYEEVV